MVSDYFGKETPKLGFTVFLSVIGHMGAWLGPNGEGLMNSFSVAEHDLGVQPLNQTVPMDEIERIINWYSPVVEQYELAMQSVTVNGQEYTANVLDDTKWLHMLIVLLYVVTAVIILITVALVAGKLLQSEKSNMAIYKSLGLHTGKLRISVVLRFFIVVLVGALSGFAAAGVLADPLIGTVFKRFGIGEFEAGFSMLGNVVPLVMVLHLISSMQAVRMAG